MNNQTKLLLLIYIKKYLQKRNSNRKFKGFKSTDHLPTDHQLIDHQPLTHWSTYHQPTNPPTHWPNNHRPTDTLTFKRPKNMKTFILQNVNTAGKMENYSSAYSIWIGLKSLIEWIIFVFIILNIHKRNRWINCVYFLAFKRYCFIPPQIFVRPFASLFYLKKLNSMNGIEELKHRMLKSSLFTGK